MNKEERMAFIKKARKEWPGIHYDRIVKIYDIETKRGQDILCMAKRYIGNIYDAYKKPSKSKIDIYADCFHMCMNAQGVNFHVCSATAQNVTISYNVSYGVVVLTRDYEYHVVY